MSPRRRSSGAAVAPGTEASAFAEDTAAIRGRIAEFAAAFRAKSLEGVLAIYAPEIVSFDLGPPLRFVGIEAYRRPWAEAFEAFVGPLDYAVHELQVTVGDGLAFSHSVNRMCGTSTDGTVIALWLRWTACWQRYDAGWLVAHESVSVPVDLATGRALLDLPP